LSGVTSGGVVQSAITNNVNFSALTKSYTIVSDELTATSAWTVNVTINDPCNVCSGGNIGTIQSGTTTYCYTGQVTGEIYVYTGNSYTNYDDLVIATLRSRGIATYSNDNGAVYEVNDLNDVTLDCSGSYSAVTKNPFSTFGVNVTSKDGDTYFFETSFSNSNVNYIGKVFGYSNFAKPRTVVPLFVEERFQALLTYGWRKGYIRGLSCDLTALPNARQSVDPTSIAWYLEKYQSPTSPWVVSELRGSKVYNLFKFTTIADGDNANIEVKLSIANISLCLYFVINL
jgi:hypothetical protein